MKSFKSTAWLLPPLGQRTLAYLQEPVLIIGTYDIEGKPNAMNAGWTVYLFRKAPLKDLGVLQNCKLSMNIV